MKNRVYADYAATTPLLPDHFRKAADKIPDEYKFTGSVDVSFNLHADGIYEMTELEKD